MIRELIHLFFPALCAGCERPLHASERLLCYTCRHRLPQTRFHLYRNNPVEQLFWGRVPLGSAASLYYFRKDGKVQHLLHQIKYRGASELGREIGRIYGRELNCSAFFRAVTDVIPVPLSAEKQRIRGYNQSEVFGEGIAQQMQVPLLPEVLLKTKHNETQTRKSRYARWQNSEGIYQVKAGAQLHNKHVLLVDDVITTGATLESCARALLEAGAEKVYVACIAAALRNY